MTVANPLTSPLAVFVTVGGLACHDLLVVQAVRLIWVFMLRNPPSPFCSGTPRRYYAIVKDDASVVCEDVPKAWVESPQTYERMPISTVRSTRMSED